MLIPELRVILVFLTSLLWAIFLIPKLARIATSIEFVVYSVAHKIRSSSMTRLLSRIRLFFGC